VRQPGHVRVYDDRVRREHQSRRAVRRTEAGARPRLDANEIDDVVAFMKTLTDGFRATNPYRAERANATARATHVNALAGRDR
jgi:hypothetical protein